MGIILLEMITKKPIAKLGHSLISYYLDENQEAIEKICKEEAKEYNKDIIDLLIKMLQIKEKDRISIDDLAKHAFFQV